MKKAVVLALLLLYGLSLLIGCTEEPAPPEMPQPSLTERYPDPAPDSLPSAATLAGSRHLPPITSQGTTLACAAYSSTYYQFTVAVSNYLAATGIQDWSPASGDSAMIFSPRFPFLRSGQSITNCYRALSQYGCLPLADCSFAGGENPDISESDWAVSTEEAEKAIRYRLTGYETVSLTDTPFDDALLLKMKAALTLGNPIILSCESSGWRFGRIGGRGCGSYGKPDDQVIYAAQTPTYGGSNHAVCIVGYDDGITCTIHGQPLRGAFQCANTNGTEWGNDGYCWILYDAFRETSDCAELNSSKEYDKTVFTFTQTAKTSQNTYQSGFCIFNMQDLYRLYTIQNDTGKYLRMTDTSMSEWTTEENASLFILMPFSNAKNIHFLDKTDFGKGNFVILESETLQMLHTAEDDPGEYRFSPFDLLSEMLDSSVFSIDGYKANIAFFESSLRLTPKLERQTLGYRLDFIDWRTDIAVGLPHRWIEFTITAADRSSISASLQNGSKHIALQGMNGKPVTGLANAQTFRNAIPDAFHPETGVFAVSLDGISGTEDWVLTVDGENVALLEAKLMDENGLVLCRKSAVQNSIRFENALFGKSDG